jgi:hypothetical protein
MAGQQGQLDRQAVVGDGMAEGLLGFADPVLDTVLVQDEPLGGGLEAAVLLQEDPQGVTQPGVLVIVIGQLPERLVHPGPQQLDRARHQGQGRDLGEAGQPRSRGTSGQRDRVRAQRLLVGAAKARDTGAGRAEGEPDSGRCPSATHGWNGEGVAGTQRQPGPGAGLVLGNKDRPPLAPRLARRLGGGMFQPGEGGPAGFSVADPAHRVG